MNAPLDASAAGSIGLGADLRVNRLGFGAMRITGRGGWGEPSDVPAVLRLLRRAVELGVNFIDTADAYGPQISERLIAQALQPYPRGLVIATKGGLVRPGPDAWNRDGRPEHLREACEASLERLNVERIDVYQLHSPDPQVPLEDSIGELVRLSNEGKIRHIGVSNVTLEELKRCERLTPVVSVQNRYNLEDRRSEELLAYCERRSIAFLPWAPLGSTGNAQHPSVPRGLTDVAQRLRITPAQAALAWLIGRSPAMLPIPGTASLGHLEANIAAAAVRLTPQDMRDIAS